MNNIQAKLQSTLGDKWAGTGAVLVVTSASIVLYFLMMRLAKLPTLPPGTPKLLTKDHWPILGTLRFFTDRGAFTTEANRAALGPDGKGTGTYSFFVGNRHIIGISGTESRKAFFDSRELDFTEGYVQDLLA